MGYHFTQRQCIKALQKIGFTDASTRRGKHFKFKAPEHCKCSQTARPFITVPKHAFYCQDAIVREVKQLCGEEIQKAFLSYL